MADILVTSYPWLKALHIISVILWMGAQTLLPSLLAAQCGLDLTSPQSKVLMQIKCQLMRRIMNPAMLATFLFGTLLASAVIGATGRLPLWLGLKLGFVFVLAALHGKLLRQFWCARDGRVQWASGRYRWVQWLNFLLLISVVVLVVARPV